MSDTDGLDPDVLRQLAAGLVAVVDGARTQLGQQSASALVARVTEHVGVELAQMPNVSLTFGGWEHANVQRGFDAYLAEHTPQAEWFGVTATGGGVPPDLRDMLSMAESWGHYRLGAVEYATVATGTDAVTEAVALGFVTTVAPGGAPVVFGLRAGERAGGSCVVQIFAADRAAATEARDAFDRHVRARDVHRGAVLQFDIGDGYNNGLVTFLPRPVVAREDVVLPAGVLETVEAHVVRSRDHTERLRSLGQHLKRGVLLHGPPGTGKTHTVRYLMSRLEGVTVAVLSGRALAQLLPAAATMVRRLQPAVLVIEDVDLVATDRSYSGTTTVLFELLNRIDGIDADADVTFLLTTNRADALEQALADRPGRVDLAVEVPRPDAAARERLLHLYAGPAGLAVDDPAELSDLIADTEGVTASFVREWVRRSVNDQLVSGEPSVVLDHAALRATLDHLTGERQHLTHSLLGGRVETPEQAPANSAATSGTSSFGIRIGS